MDNRNLIDRLKNHLYEMRCPGHLSFGAFTFKFRYSKIPRWMREYLVKNIETYEDAERLMVERFLVPGDVVVEGGTSIGLICGLASEIITEKGRITTIEADKNLVEIASSINKNKNVTFLNGLLVMIQQDSVRHFKPDGWLGGKFVDENEEGSHPVNAISIVELTETVKANTWILDIEGAEKDILKLPELPTRLNKVIIEFHPHVYGNSTMEAIVEKITENGFSMRLFRNDVYAFTR